MPPVHLHYNAQQAVIKLNEIDNTVLLCWMQFYSNLDRGVLAAQLPTHWLLVNAGFTDAIPDLTVVSTVSCFVMLNKR